ncbi:hypothetical protein CFOL_v3_12080, partial [Cephalotus follicularis]
KLNCDDSAKENLGWYEIGGLFRDDRGFWFGGFSTSVGVSTILIAELWSIRLDIPFAIQPGYTNLIVESNSLAIVELINSGVLTNHLLSALVSNCITLRYGKKSIYT